MHRTSSFVSTAVVVSPANGRKNSFLLATFCFAVLLIAIASQPLHAAGVPALRYAYVVDQVADAVDMFSINLSTGILTHLANCPANAMPLAPFGIVSPTTAKVDPTGSFLYITDSSPLGQIIGLAIQPNGCLATFQVIPTAGSTPSSLHISSSGEFLYVSSTCPGGGGGCVEGFTIAPNGFLAAVGPIAAGASQGAVVVDPVRQIIYASDPVGGSIFESTFNPITGVLNPWLPPNAAPNPSAMALDPVGNGLVGPAASQFLLALNPGPKQLFCYTFSTALGPLGAPNVVATGVNPFDVGKTKLGQFAYITNNGGNSVQAYNINNCTGAHGIALDGAAVAMPAGSNPAGLAVDQTGRFVYVAANGGNLVYGYKVNLNNGTLAKIGAWATAAGPIHVATMP